MTTNRSKQKSTTQVGSIELADSSPRKTGIVESAKCDKTRKVVINFSTKHPKYGKYIRHKTVLQVHDEANESSIGDRVEVAECRPISKNKSWVVTRIIKRAEA